jgi:MOSC domain-containing protein YiiM
VIGTVAQIAVSDGGVPKLAVDRAVVTTLGILGDRQRDTEHHGGPLRALCLYSLEVIERLQGEGHPIAPGSAGENVTVQGIDWAMVTPGTRLLLGPEVEAEVTRYTTPCATNARWFADGDFTRILQSRHPGWSRVYARVLVEGVLTTGDRVEVAG